MAQFPIKNALFQGSLDGTPTSGTLNLSDVSLEGDINTTGNVTAAIVDCTNLEVTSSASFSGSSSGTTSIVAPAVAAGTITLPASTGTLATLARTETFTNKTLTAPVISTISNTGTLTLPTSTDTLVGRATTDTLTNKTLTSPVITNIAPGANFTITQNSVAPFTSVNSGATADTLVLSTGRVGIGTSTPSELLDVVRNSGTFNGPRIRLTNSNASVRNATLQFCYGTTPTVGWQFGQDPSATGAAEFVIASGDAGTYSARFSLTTSTFTLAGGSIFEVQNLSGAGAVNLTSAITKLTTTGAAQALTLANGTNGQRKTIVHAVDGGSAVLTPTTATGYTTITFTNAGESAVLIYFTTQGWMIESLYGAVAA